MKTITKLFEAYYFNIIREKKHYVALKKDKIKVIFDENMIEVRDDKNIIIIPFSVKSVLSVVAYTSLPIIFRQELREIGSDDIFDRLFNNKPKTKVEKMFADKLLMVLMKYHDLKQAPQF